MEEIKTNEIYRDAFDELGITQAQLAELVNLGMPITQSVRGKISDKLALRKNVGADGTPKNERGVTKVEALAMELLRLLNAMLKGKEMGITDIEFDETGRISDKTFRAMKKAIK
ncbi:hypothetical protein [Cellvibrio sp. QJXJ]|uniref:hypothetical protein n=1 Tax=Cellvibrio sp. QJXJ TaxID=2964606 RepID=UPI0021C28BE2|nr:hypothetical protein [Cellvibrio sp. QJXJ]UUA75155.1 hypothetical protein NNX04_22115 [Cellvibrio sp. QJXJ]